MPLLLAEESYGICLTALNWETLIPTFPQIKCTMCYLSPGVGHWGSHRSLPLSCVGNNIFMAYRMHATV
ncbi:unnamed protein product [Musa textilis]